MEPFSIRFKQFWDVSEARMILDKWIPRLTHESDGLIFNPLLDSYVAGRCDNLLKWKPEELNSVDFKLNIITRQQEGMLKEKIGQLFVGSGGQFAELDLKLNKDARQHNGRIVECTMDKETNKWLFLRVRDDKSFPNAYETAKSVCMSIMQPVTKDWLLFICEKHRFGINHMDISNNSSFDKDSKILMPPPKSRPIHDK